MFLSRQNVWVIHPEMVDIQQTGVKEAFMPFGGGAGKGEAQLFNDAAAGSRSPRNN
jgi:hypothetical protein